MACVMEYHGLDEEDKGGGGAPAASRKKRALAWQGLCRVLKKRMVR